MGSFPVAKRAERTRRPRALHGFRPSAHSERLEYMDLVGVKECTDLVFLPEKYRKIGHEELETRLEALRRRIN